MSARLHPNADDSFQPEPIAGKPDFLDARSRKRELMDELSAAWEAGQPVRAEEVLPRWPEEPAADSDVAGLLFEEYQQRQKRGDENSLSDLEARFPEHRDSLASLLRNHDMLRSVGGSSKSVPRLALPTVGDTLFGFRMRHELGRGAFACVFMAEQEHLAGRPVVLKVSAVEGNEPQTLAQLQHTNIVPIYSVHEDAAAGTRAVCMPYFGGASLSAVLHAAWAVADRPTSGEQLVRALEAVQASPWEPKRADDDAAPRSGTPTAPAPLTWLRSNDYFRATARLIAQLASGLDHAHERGIYHRDIKPSNILLSGDGTPMLLDFNLAEDIHSAKARASATLGGTVSYMAPEHLRALIGRDAALARKVDHRSDTYSLGMVLYEMLVGQSPFKQSASYTPIPTMIEAMAVERSESSPSLRKKRPDAPWDLESIVRKCLDPKPERRYQRAAHIAEDLEAFLTDRPLPHAPQLSRRERLRKWLRRHPRLASSGSVAVVAAVLLVTIGAALFGVRGHLAKAESQVQANNVHDRLRLHDAGTLRALCLVNVADVQDENLRQGAKVCEATLDLFGVLNRTDWATDPAWQYLSAEERERLAENTRELLLLLAWARVRNTPNDPAVLRDALTLVDRAEAIPGLAPTPALYADRAHYLDKLGEKEAAAAARTRSTALAPTTARDYYLLAMTHVRVGHLDQALTALDQALRLNPHHYWSVVQRGLVYLDQRQYVRAVADFGDCVGLNPEFAWGYFNLGYAFAQTGDKASAIKNYTAAIDRDSNFMMAYQNRATLHLEQGQHAAALADADRAIALGGNYAVLHASRAVALEGLHRFSESEAAIATAMKKADGEKARPGEEPTALRIRWPYAFAISNRKPEVARELFEEVLDRDPKHAQALYGLALLAMVANRNEEALKYYNRVLEFKRNWLEARRFRAIVLARLRRFTEAMDDVNACLTAEPKSGPNLYAAACVASRYAEATARADAVAAQAAAQRSLQFLGLAFAEGYGQGHVDDDPDLAHVRGLPACKEFLKSH